MCRQMCQSHSAHMVFLYQIQISFSKKQRISVAEISYPEECCDLNSLAILRIYTTPAENRFKFSLEDPS